MSNVPKPVVLDSLTTLVDYMDAFFAGKVPGFPEKNLSPNQIGYLLDHDGTLGERDPEDNSNTSFSKLQRENIGNTTDSSCFLFGVTSRDLPIMEKFYHEQHANTVKPLSPKKFAMAGSGGYAFQKGKETVIVVPVVDKNGTPYDQSLVEKGAEATRWITDKLAEKYPGLVTSDPRRLMAAALCGKFPNEEKLSEFQACARELTENRQKHLENKIELKMDPGLKNLTGYIDFKLAAASKDKAVTWILNNLENLGYEKPKLIVAAGDTEPDEKIVEAARKAGFPVLAFCVDNHIKDHSKGIWNAICPTVEMFHYALMYMHSPDKVRDLAADERMGTPIPPEKVMTKNNLQSPIR